jgi:hypothetical protein
VRRLSALACHGQSSGAAPAALSGSRMPLGRGAAARCWLSVLHALNYGFVDPSTSCAADMHRQGPGPRRSGLARHAPSRRRSGHSAGRGGIAHAPVAPHVAARAGGAPLLCLHLRLAFGPDPRHRQLREAPVWLLDHAGLVLRIASTRIWGCAHGCHSRCSVTRAQGGISNHLFMPLRVARLLYTRPIDEGARMPCVGESRGRRSVVTET